VAIPSISGKTLGSDDNDYLGVHFWFDAGSSFNSRTNSLGQQSGTFDIAQVQLEPGSVATPFEQRQYAAEYFLCSRYFHIIRQYIRCYGYHNGAGGITIQTYSFPTIMRTSPTITNAWTGGTNASTAGVLVSGSTHFQVYVQSASAGAYGGYYDSGNNMDAEL
jgi:hypothetical protein